MNNALHLLLVDDNANDRELVRHELRREFPGVQIEQAADADGLAQALKRPSFEIVNLDYKLIWTDGLAVLRASKARWPECAVIMFTSSGNEAVAVEAMKAGLDDHLHSNPKGPLRETFRV